MRETILERKERHFINRALDLKDKRFGEVFISVLDVIFAEQKGLVRS